MSATSIYSEVQFTLTLIGNLKFSRCTALGTPPLFVLYLFRSESTHVGRGFWIQFLVPTPHGPSPIFLDNIRPMVGRTGTPLHFYQLLILSIFLTTSSFQLSPPQFGVNNKLVSSHRLSGESSGDYDTTEENDAMKFLREKGRVRPFVPLPANAIGVDEGADGVGKPMNQVSSPPPPPPSGLDTIREAMDAEVVDDEGGGEREEGQGEWDDALQAYVFPEFEVKEE